MGDIPGMPGPLVGPNYMLHWVHQLPSIATVSAPFRNGPILREISALAFAFASSTVITLILLGQATLLTELIRNKI